MKFDNDTSDPAEQTLARRFQQLRETEAVHAPAFPTEQELRERVSEDAAVPRIWLRAVPKFALAASVLVAVFLYLKPVAQQNPGDLYADIMSANAIATDSLLSLSSTIAPQSTSVPGLFDFDASLDGAFDTN